MAHRITYLADFECPQGHRFRAPCAAGDTSATRRCPDCYDAWVEANVPKGTQQSPPEPLDDPSWKTL